MRRPAVFICGACILGMASEFFWGIQKNITVFSVVVFGIFVAKNLVRSHNKKFMCLLCAASIVFAMGALHFHHQYARQGDLEKYAGEYLQVQGQVCQVLEKDRETHKLIVKVKSLEGVGKLNRQEKLMINIYGEYPKYYKLQGRDISVTGFIEIPAERRNPKTFDYRQYLKTKNIRVTMGTPAVNMKVSDEIHNPYSNVVSHINYVFKSNVQVFFDEEVAGLLMGMLFGDNSGLSEDVYEAFQKNGICHILAVSGLHIGALYTCINAVFRSKRNIIINIIIIMSLIFYASMANFSPSVMRAVIMIILNMASKYLYCRYDMLTASAITMLIMTSVNPLLLLNLGFQLSFMAIYTLAVILPAAIRMYDKWITSAVVIQAGIGPISAFAFNYVSFSAFVANIPVIFIGGILIPLGMLLLLISTATAFLPLNEGGATYITLNFLFQIAGIVTEFFSKMLLFINDVSFIKGVSFIYVTSPPLHLLFSYYSLLFFISTEYCRILWQRKYYRKILVIAAAVLCVSFSFGSSMKDGFEEVQLTFVDVGQGDCLLIKTAEGKNVLIDSGGSSNYDVGKKLLLPYLLKNGVRKIDMALITHLHQDHAGGLSTLSKEIPIEKVGVYEGNQLNAAKVSSQLGVDESNLVYLTKGQRVKLGEELEIELLYPEKKTKDEYEVMMADGKDENASCLVMKVIYQGVSIIMTGDLDTAGEAQVLMAGGDPKADILKVAHHGSKYGSSEVFLEAVSPKLAIVQVGENTYGHPSRETLERIRAGGAHVYRNDLNGAIGIEIKNHGQIKIHTMI